MGKAGGIVEGVWGTQRVPGAEPRWGSGGKALRSQTQKALMHNLVT